MDNYFFILYFGETFYVSSFLQKEIIKDVVKKVLLCQSSKVKRTCQKRCIYLLPKFQKFSWNFNSFIRFFLGDSCLVLATSRNSLSKYGNMWLFPLKLWRLLRLVFFPKKSPLSIMSSTGFFSFLGGLFGRHTEKIRQKKKNIVYPPPKIEIRNH